MKLLPTVVLVLTGLLAGTACQRTPPKPDNVAVEPGSLASTATGAGVDSTAKPQLDSAMLDLKKQLNLTEQQTINVNEILQDTKVQHEALNAERVALLNQPVRKADTNAKRAVIRKRIMELHKKKLERINAVLTPEQAIKYQQIRSEPPAGVRDVLPPLTPKPPQSME